MFDGTCCICYNAFGPKGGYYLGTCEHMDHPICLIAHMLIRRRCCQCKAPFHEQLYELFGLCPYMPPSWEHNPEITPSMPSKWGEDLVWNWRISAHSLNKLAFSSANGWENNHEEIVRGLLFNFQLHTEDLVEFHHHCVQHIVNMLAKIITFANSQLTSRNFS